MRPTGLSTRRGRPTPRMAAPGLDKVMAFLTEHGFASAASALRDDVLARTADGDADSAAALDPQLPPLRLPTSASGGGGALAPASPGSSSGSASSSAFVSMRSSPSGLLNPYGLWSPPHSHSDASSSELEFGTARQYDTTDLFFQERWLYDDHLFHSKPDDDDGKDKKEDKFVLGAHGGSGRIQIGVLSAGDDHRHEHVGNDGCEGCAEVYTCSSPLCGCCGEGLKDEEGIEVVKDSSSAVYGRYKIMDDQTEILDECGMDVFQLKQSGDDVLECDLPRDPGRGEGRLKLIVVDKELQMLTSFDTDADADVVASPRLIRDATDIVELDDNIEKKSEKQQ